MVEEIEYIEGENVPKGDKNSLARSKRAKSRLLFIV